MNYPVKVLPMSLHRVLPFSVHYTAFRCKCNAISNPSVKNASPLPVIPTEVMGNEMEREKVRVGCEWKHTIEVDQHYLIKK